MDTQDCELEEHAVELSVEGHSSNTLDVNVRMDDSTQHNVSNSDSFQSGSLLWNGQLQRPHHLIEPLKVDMKVDPLLSGAASSILIAHAEGKTLQWHDIITDLSEENYVMHHHSPYNENINTMITSIDGSLTPIGKLKDINYTKASLTYFGIKEVKKFKEMNDEWLQKVKNGKLVATNTKQNL